MALKFSTQQTVISTTADMAHEVAVADVDGDGDLDVLSASINDDKIVWYENDDSGKFTKRTVSNTADGARSVTTADLDGDGDLDVLSASWNDDKIAWYENNGSQGFTAHTITTTADGAHSVITADVDGDGDLDVLSASSNDNKIAWYENNGSGKFTTRIITTTAAGAHSVAVADVDGDGDLDVLSASSNDNKIAWYENNGSQSFTPHTISTTVAGAHKVAAADMDGDGDLDVVAAAIDGDQITWYENNGSQSFTARTVATTIDGPHSLTIADLDSDGDLDVLSASQEDDKVAWHENDGKGNFTPHTISTAANGARSVTVTDLDGDGDLDVISASLDDDKIAWYENQTLPLQNGNTGGGTAPPPPVVPPPAPPTSIHPDWVPLNPLGDFGGKTGQVFSREVYDGTTLVGFELAIGLMDSISEKKLIKAPNGATSAFVPLQWGSPTAHSIGGRGPLGDFNGDRNSDILFTNNFTHEVGVWLIENGVAVTQKVIDIAAPDWKLVNTNDFDGSGTTDLLFTKGDQESSTQIGVWTLDNRANILQQKLIDVASAGWSVIGANDFDGNGTADILLAQVSLDGSTNIGVWTLDSNADILSQYYLANAQTALAADWQILDHNDFNGDGKADLAFKSEAGLADDRYAIWLLDGHGGFLDQKIVGSYADGGFEYSGSTDANGDGNADLNFINPTTQETAVWLMNGTTRL
jgi:hypothetical protein